MPTNLPVKLKNDAIAEALFEIQFESDELGEVIIGRLSDSEDWNGYSTTRLGTSNIPETLRDSDPKLRFQPVIERRAEDGSGTVRIGSHVISFHTYAPYPGWANFEPKLLSMINLLVDKTTNLRVSRLGFRYVNFLQSGLHNLNSISDLTLKIELKDLRLTDGINLAYLTTSTDSHNVMLKVATSNFVNLDTVPNDLVCIADVDVFSPAQYEVNDSDSISQWLNQAHDIEKSSFFSLFPDALVEELKEE